MITDIKLTRANIAVWHSMCMLWMRPSMRTYIVQHKVYNLHSPKNTILYICYSTDHFGSLYITTALCFAIAWYYYCYFCCCCCRNCFWLQLKKKKQTVTFLNYIWKWRLTWNFVCNAKKELNKKRIYVCVVKRFFILSCGLVWLHFCIKYFDWRFSIIFPKDMVSFQYLKYLANRSTLVAVFMLCAIFRFPLSEVYSKKKIPVNMCMLFVKKEMENRQ